MIRNSWRSSLSVFTLLLVLGAFVIPVISAYAGDMDGVNGYSIRLKQKDFVGDEGASAALNPQTQDKATDLEQLQSSLPANIASEKQAYSWILVRYWFWSWCLLN